MNKKPRALFDIECLRNYFLICFRDIETGAKRHFEMYEGHPLDKNGLMTILRSFTLVGFNSNTYDVPMLKLALRLGVTNQDLKNVSDAIINRNMRSWETEKQFNLPQVPWLDSIDLIEPAPAVNIGLKLYGGRLHSKRLQDLPIDPHADILPEQRAVIVEYCFNDLDNTYDLYRHIEPQIDLRCAMTEQYGVDLRSKSDAQIAEAVIRSEIERIRGEKIYRPEFQQAYSFKYNPPAFLKFETQQMLDAFEVVCNSYFPVGNGGVEMPREVAALALTMGGSTYKMGIGGLHSTESKVVHQSDDDYVLVDNDVASYYPAIILACDLYPEHLGRDFLNVYRSIRERRIAAKRNKDKVTDMTLKIVLNGTFGKLGSPYSILYSPNLMIQVTMTGQLSLLMLIERLELEGISVVSANTDGIVVKCRRDRVDEMRAIIKAWERDTTFEMESVEYSALYSRDVNSYIAVKTDGSVKQKGAFAFVGSKGSPAEKNPANYVCVDAVINYLTKGIPLEETIEWCLDIRRFVSVRRVTGGAMYRGEYLGKTVRWYYAKDSVDCITYATNGNKVARTDGCKPLMELNGFPIDVNHDWYVREARSLLVDLGWM